MGYSRYAVLTRYLRCLGEIQNNCICMPFVIHRFTQAGYSKATQHSNPVLLNGSPNPQKHSIDWDVKPPDLSQINSSNVMDSSLLSVATKEYNDLEYLVDDIDEKRLGPLDTCDFDLSHIGPDFPVAYNFAAYANDSLMIRKLAQLGVDFSKLERRKGIMKFLLPLDFVKDMQLHIRFLTDCGVPPEKLGAFLTKNPLVFKESLDDLHTRIRYLGAHKFSRSMIAQIITKNPYWIMFSTKRIDSRLGHFQAEFNLSGEEIRLLATREPRLITYKMDHIQQNTFAVREEMGFDKPEVNKLLLTSPRIWMKRRSCIVERFDYAHNEMKLSHKLIAQQPEVLTCRLSRLRERHMFLVTQDRAQYDPLKLMYVSMKALVTGTDAEFCMNVARTPVEIFNMYLKTL